MCTKMKLIRNATALVSNGACSAKTPVHGTGVRCMSAVAQTGSLDPKEELATARPYEEMPKVPSLPLIGAAWTFMPFIGKYKLSELNLSYGKKFEEYGGIFREDFGKDIRIVNLYNVNDFEKYFRQEGKDANRLLFETIKLYRKNRPDRFLGGGLAATGGKEWYNLRSKVQPHLLRPKEIHSYLPGVDEIAQEFAAQLKELSDDKHEVADIRKELTRWGIESVAFIGLDTRLGALSSSEDSLAMINMGEQLFQLFQRLEFGFGFLWKIVPTPAYRKLVKTLDYFSDLSMKHIEAAAKRLEENRDPDKPMTLLETFLVQENMDPRLANTMLMDMLLAGVDTTSSSTAFVLYHLAKNPLVQEKAHQDIKRALKIGNGHINTEVLSEIRYLKACIKESMRMTPTVSAFPRTLKEDIVVSGYRVPAGVMLMFVTSVACKMESNFKNASQFRPERWIDHKHHNPFAFMPFGFGVRSCIGRRIAEMEMQTLLIRILEKYRVEYHYEDLECKTRLVNMPKYPLRIRLISR